MASEKITALIEEVKGLTVLELSELVHALEDEFGVSAAAMAAPAAGGGAAPAAEEKTEFAVTEQAVVTRMDENGVNVTVQSAEAIRNAYQLRYVMSSINSDLTLLRTAVRGQ